MSALEELLNVVEEVGKTIGLIINTDKTKYMRKRTYQHSVAEVNKNWKLYFSE